MPVTPVFLVRQDEDFVFVAVRVPYVRVSDLEYVIDGQDLSFFVKPYLLRLHFPGQLVDDERAKALYDPSEENGTVHLHLPKAVAGEVFPDLDLLTKLQQPRRRGPGGGRSTGGLVDIDKERALLDELISGEPPTRPPPAPEGAERASRPLVQVLSSVEFGAEEVEPAAAPRAAQTNDAAAAGPSSPLRNDDSAAAIAELLAKTDLGAPELRGANPGLLGGRLSDSEAAVSLGAQKYGFNDGLSNFFRDLSQDFAELIELPEPDDTPADQRRALRIDQEDEAFDAERYLGDFVYGAKDPVFIAAKEYLGFWERPDAESFAFSDKERKQMRDLTNREFLAFSPSETQRAMCALLDVVAAFAFDDRATQGDPTVESAWTIRTLSPTLSWLDAFELPIEVAGAVMHRALVFPYLRHLSLAARAVEDAVRIFEIGKRAVTRAVLAVHDVFAHSDQYYLLNRLYLTDMCIWAQQVDAGELSAFARLARAQVGQALANPLDLVRWDLAALQELCLLQDQDQEQEEVDAPNESD